MTSLTRGVFGIYRDAFSGIPRTVWWLAAGLFVNRAGTMVIPFLSLYFTDSIGMSATVAGRLIAAFGLGSLGGSWFGGWLCDRMQGLRVMHVSLLCTGALFLAVIPVRQVQWLYLFMFLIGLVGDLFRPAMMVEVTRASSDDLRVRSFALVRLAANAGMAVGPAVGGWVAAHSYSWLFVGDGLTCWAASIVLMLGLRHLHSTSGASVATTPSSRGGAWGDLPFLALLGLTLLISMIFFQVFTVLPLHLRDSYGLAQTSIGSILALNALLIVIFEMVLLRKLERRSQLRVAALGGLLLGGGLVILPLGPPAWIAYGSTVIWSFGEMLLLPVLNVIVSRRGTDANTGSYMGAYMVTFSLAFVVAPALGGYVYDQFGAGVLWSAAGIGGVVVAAGMLRLRSTFEPQSENEPSIAST